jgi:hypothetical protein
MYTECLYDIPHGHIVYKPFRFHGPTKFSQIGIVGLKMYHLATLQAGIAGKTAFLHSPTFGSYRDGSNTRVDHSKESAGNGRSEGVEPAISELVTYKPFFKG